MEVLLIALAATILIQCGYFLWKISADDDQPKFGEAPTAAVVRALISDWRWVLGLALTIVGWLLFIQATAIGDISLVQPLTSAGDLLLIILAVVFLKERLRRLEWVGVLSTLLGACGLAQELNHTDAATYDGTLLALLIAGAGALAASTLIWRRRRRPSAVTLAVFVGLSFGCGTVLTKAMTFGATGATHPILPWSIALSPLLPPTVLADVLGLIALQAAFQRGRAALIVPLHLAIANVVTITGATAIFGERMTLLRVAGMVLIFAGTAILHLKEERIRWAAPRAGNRGET